MESFSFFFENLTPRCFGLAPIRTKILLGEVRPMFPALQDNPDNTLDSNQEYELISQCSMGIRRLLLADPEERSVFPQTEDAVHTMAPTLLLSHI